MPPADFDAQLLSEVHLRLSRGLWHVIVRYDERRYKLGEWRLYADAHRACSTSALERTLGSLDQRAMRLVAEEY